MHSSLFSWNSSVNLNEKPNDQNNVHASLSVAKPQLVVSDGFLSMDVSKRNTNQNQANISLGDGNTHQDIAVSDSETHNVSTSVMHENPVNVLIRDAGDLQDTSSSVTQVISDKPIVTEASFQFLHNC